MIKILWLEDEIDKIEAFLDRMYLNDIELIHCQTANDFIVELNKNTNNYDAVILDVMGVENSLEEKPSSKAFRIAHEAIMALKYKKLVPFFVLSAQLTKDENQGLKEYIGDTNIYIKSKDEDRLISNIKASVTELPDFTLKNRYAELLTVFNNTHLKEENFSRIFNLIKWGESAQWIDNTEDKLTSIRKLIEAVFHALSRHGLVPSEITSKSGSINGTSLFLSNKHKEFELIEPFYIHPTVANSIFRLVNITQDGSHTEGELKLRVDEYMQQSPNDYLFKSCLYLLFDIIIWYKNLVNQYRNPEFNKILWKTREKSEPVSGKVINVNIKGFAFFEPDSQGENIYIPQHLVSEHSLKNGTLVFAEIEEYKDNQTGELKKKAKHIEIHVQ